MAWSGLSSREYWALSKEERDRMRIVQFDHDKHPPSWDELRAEASRQLMAGADAVREGVILIDPTVARIITAAKRKPRKGGKKPGY